MHAQTNPAFAHHGLDPGPAIDASGPQYAEVGPAAPGAPRRPQYAEVGPAAPEIPASYDLPGSYPRSVHAGGTTGTHPVLGGGGVALNAAGTAIPPTGRSPAFSASDGYEQPDDLLPPAALGAPATRYDLPGPYPSSVGSTTGTQPALGGGGVESNAAGTAVQPAGRSPAFSASVGYEQPDDVLAAVAAPQSAGEDNTDLGGPQARYAQRGSGAAGGSVASGAYDLMPAPGLAIAARAPPPMAKPPSRAPPPSFAPPTLASPGTSEI